MIFVPVMTGLRFRWPARTQRTGAGYPVRAFALGDVLGGQGCDHGPVVLGKCVPRDQVRGGARFACEALEPAVS